MCVSGYSVNTDNVLGMMPHSETKEKIKTPDSRFCRELVIWQTPNDLFVYLAINFWHLSFIVYYPWNFGQLV